jgi:DNA-binding GntR family transcriptional regulator
MILLSIPTLVVRNLKGTPMQEVEKNIPLGERAYYVIKAMIIRAELAPGQSVPESVLAKQLGISRSPVKAALTRLQEDGLLTGEAWKVPSVVPLDLKYVDNVYQVRKALETQCALQSIDTIPSAKVEEFAAMLDTAEIELRDGDVTQVRNAYEFIQKVLREYCDNALLRVMLGKLQDHLARVRYASRSNDDQEFLKREYWMMREELDALRARDGARLAAALNNQHEQFRRWILDHWDAITSPTTEAA